MISIKPITKDNWKEAIALKVTEEQKPFIANNLHSIAESSFYDTAFNYGIFYEDQMVGFVLLFNPPEEPENAHIVRFMIDQSHQNKGYGTKGLHTLLEILTEKQNKKSITLTVIPENQNARAFYEKNKFVNTEEIVEGELKYRYTSS
jgi:diamine N-acetyltransferase